MSKEDFNLYGKVVKAALHDEKVRKGLASDTAGTLRSLGVNVTPEIERRIAEAKAKAPQGEAAYSSAFVSSVVQVATSPAVQVAVSVVTSSSTEAEKETK